jgi:hypothetical protein
MISLTLQRSRVGWVLLDRKSFTIGAAATRTFPSQ